MIEHTRAEFRVVDDDGVLVIVDRAALRVAASGERDDLFPGTLGRLVERGRALAWLTGLEGEVTIALEIAQAAPVDALGPFRLAVAEVPLFVLPYSQFTMALLRAGEVERIDGLFGEATVEPGLFTAWVHRESDNAWTVTLVRGGPDERLAVQRQIVDTERRT